jgi:hypothetical protein
VTARARLLRHVGGDHGPLASNAAHNLAQRHALLHFPTGAVYSYIPKNACSTLRLSFAVANGCLAGPEDWTWIHENNRTFNPALRDLVMAPYAFVVLRCPHARLASAYLDKIVGRTTHYWSLQRMMDDALSPDTLTFRRFVGLMQDRRVLHSDPHWRSQADFLVYQDYDDWFSMTDIVGMADRLRDRIGLDLIDARPLTQHGTGRFAPEEGRIHADTPVTKIEAMMRQGRIPSHAALYDARLAGAVARLYPEDLVLCRDRIGAGALMFPDLVPPGQDGTGIAS